MKQILISIILFSVSSLTLGSIMSNSSRDIAEQDRSQSVDHKGQHLLLIVRDLELRKSDPERVTNAIVQLGEMKSVESIQDLIALLAFKRTLKGDNPDPNFVQEIHPVPPTERYPATGALVRIGTPSLSALAHAIATHEVGSVESENAIFAVSMIFRENPEEGVSYLQSAATAAADLTGMNRLRKAADHLDSLAKQVKKTG